MQLGLKKIFLLVFVLLLLNGKGQPNLVPNWSFEGITSCPTWTIFTSTLPQAPPWQNPTTPGTPDLFSSCDTVIPGGSACPEFATPCNAAGTQAPHSGNNYAGIFDYGLHIYNGNGREYIQTALTNTLVTNKKYCVSFFVSLAERSTYATSRIGAYISSSPVSVSTWTPIPVSPQIEPPFNTYMSDTLIWNEIKGVYSAFGNEGYITIGNFYDNSNTDTLYIGGSGHSGDIYTYIDDVSITEFVSANAGSDTLICAGIKINRDILQTFGAQYNWSILNGDLNSIDSTQIASPTLNPAVTTTYVLQKQQCGIFSYDTLVIHVPQIYPAIVSADTTVCVGDTITLAAENNCAWCIHSWNTGSAYLQIPIFPIASTVYSFSQTDSCFTTTDEVWVGVEYCYSPIISIPNIFTPNKDEINDTWLPSIKNGASIGDYSLEIYNRWGIQMLKTDKIEAGWDGRTTAGIECVEGTYYYLINYMDMKESVNKSLNGFLQLSR